MNYAKLVMSLGVWVAVLPLLGFPASWRQVIFGFTGVLLIITGNSLRGKNSTDDENKEHVPPVTTKTDHVTSKNTKVLSTETKVGLEKKKEEHEPVMVNNPQLENSPISEDFLSRISD